MKKKIVAISLAAIVVVSFVAAMPTALGSDDVNLTVTMIDPRYVFEGLDNVIIGYVENTGTAGTTTGNVCLEVTNAAGVVVYSEKNTDNLPVAAGATVEVEFQWKPAAVENVTLTVTADCDNDVAETDETDNSLADTRNTGDCLVDATTMMPATCYGYRGQNPMDTKIAGTGNLIYTTGDYKRYQNTVNFNISGDTNRITSATAGIPDGAEIKMARLYVYYDWYKWKVYGPTPDFGMTFNGNSISPDNCYTDTKGFTTIDKYQNGMQTFDVTAYVSPGPGVYTATRTVPYVWGNGTTAGMALLIAYTEPCDPYIEYYIDEGYDYLTTSYYKYAGGHYWQSYVKPEDATTTASFPCIDNPPEEIVEATLFTATLYANPEPPYKPPESKEETVSFNGVYKTSAWPTAYKYEIGTDSWDVTSELQLNPAGENEVADFQERNSNYWYYGRPYGNGFAATNAILIVEKTADVTIEPETLNLKSNGEWITAYIELPGGDNVADIDVNTVLLDCEIPAENDPQYGFVTDPDSYLVDHDGDGIQERLVKFDRTAVIEYLQQTDYDGETGIDSLVELCVTGEAAGKQFKGCDTVTVIEPGN